MLTAMQVQSSMKKVAEGFIDWDEELTLCGLAVAVHRTESRRV